MELSNEKIFFKSISVDLLSYVEKNIEKKRLFYYKKEDEKKLNVGTEMDMHVEKIIIEGIRKQFPNDLILSEETNAHQKIIENGRLWIVDPICGTISMSRGIKMFCTNIALVSNGKIVASCVIDYDRKEYVWSVGQGKVYVNNASLISEQHGEDIFVDINTGAIPYWNKHIRKVSKDMFAKLILVGNFRITHYATSLAFLYVATGKINGYISPFNHVWDAVAANFLIEQAGGIVTDLYGKPWTFTSSSAVGAVDKTLHKKLLSFINS